LHSASAQEATFPQRLILFWTPHGTVYDAWRPTGSESAFTLGPILQPLAPFQSRLCVLDGLDITHSAVPAPPHTEGIGLVWTGSHLGAGTRFMTQEYPHDWVEGPSVDQVVASRIGTTTPYKSLEFGVDPGGNSPVARMIYAGAGQPLQPESDAGRAFDRLFAGVNLDDAARLEFERARDERRSVLGLVSSQATRARDRVSMDDRFKLQAHLDGLSALEKRLDVARPADCRAPTLEGGSGEPWQLQQQFDVMAAALSCDMTRVASMQFIFGDNDGHVYDWLGIARGHHDITHEGDSNLEARGQLVQISTWYAEQLAYLLRALDAIPEGAGTVLDNTLVVWGSELGTGNSHSFEQVPFVLAGGAAGRLRMGRYLQYGGEAHNRMLVSICHAMGLTDVTSFGTTDGGTGPLSGLG
jgi:hypothetical protein